MTAFSQFNLAQKFLIAGAAVLFSAVLSSLVFSSGVTHAGVGSGGGAAGGGGGHQAVHGYGWWVYDVNGPGPNHGFRNGASWASVQATCRGAVSVVGFIVLDSGGNQMIYDWPGWNNPGRYRSGGNFVTIPQATDYYNTVPAHEKAGFTWGANVAWFCYGDAATEWSVSGESRINKGTPNLNTSVTGTINATPGETLNWYHRLYNNGPENMDKQIYYNVGRSGHQHGWDGIIAPEGWASGGVGNYFVQQYAPGASYTRYTVNQDDVSNTICQNIRWTNIAWNNPSDGAAAAACAYIPYNFTLIPTITNITDGQVVEGALGEFPVQGRVTNTGTTKTTPGIQWQITQVKYRPGAAIPNQGGGNSPSNPCAYFTGNLTCNSVANGTEAGGYPHGGVGSYTGTGTLADEPVGTRLCFAMSAQRISSSTNDWGHSRLFCRIVGKKPKLQVFGGDVIVGRGYSASGSAMVSGVTTSTTNKGGTYYGSWSEYAIIPSGLIVGMASGSGYAGGLAATPAPNLCNVSPYALSLLSFSNATKPGAAPPSCSSSNIGGYSITSASTYDAIRARFAPNGGTAPLTGNIAVSDLAAGTIYSGTGSITLTSTPGSTTAVAPMPVGKWVVINAPTANVRINSNLTYINNPLTRPSDIPQLVIIAQNITIAEDVTQVDAWLFAKGSGANGTVNTCDSAVAEPAGLTASVCSSQLVINGPVVASHLLLYRTHGSGVGGDSSVPAEIFNLRPDAYMWAGSLPGASSKARTVITTELPPRF